MRLSASMMPLRAFMQLYTFEHVQPYAICIHFIHSSMGVCACRSKRAFTQCPAALVDPPRRVSHKSNCSSGTGCPTSPTAAGWPSPQRCVPNVHCPTAAGRSPSTPKLLLDLLRRWCPTPMPQVQPHLASPGSRVSTPRPADARTDPRG